MSIKSKNYAMAHLPLFLLFVLTAIVFLLSPNDGERLALQTSVEINNMKLSHTYGDGMMTLTARRAEGRKGHKTLLYDTHLNINQDGRQILLEGKKGELSENFSTLSFDRTRGRLWAGAAAFSLSADYSAYDVKESLLSSRNVVVVSDNYRLLGDHLLWRQDGELILQGNVQGVFSR